MNTPAVLIMAAGRGTRMRSRLPKVLHPLCGRPMLLWTVHAAREAGAERIVVVLGDEADAGARRAAARRRGRDPGPARRHRRRGHAGARRAGGLRARDRALGRPPAARRRPSSRRSPSATPPPAPRRPSRRASWTIPASTGASCAAPDGSIERIVETKNPGDATPEEIAIKEINAGTYAFAVEPLFEALAGVRADNSQGEYYLGDVLPLLRGAGHGVVAHLTEDEAVGLGVNTRADLARRRGGGARAPPRAAHARGRHDRGSGLDDDRRRRDDRRGHDDRALHASCAERPSVGAGCTIGPTTTLIDCRARPTRSRVVHSYLQECEVGPRCTVGPFTHLRPGTRLAEGAKAGAFVEIKNSEHRARREGPAPLLHRGRRPRARARTSAPARSPRTTTAPRSTAP